MDETLHDIEREVERVNRAFQWLMKIVGKGTAFDTFWKSLPEAVERLLGFGEVEILRFEKSGWADAATPGKIASSAAVLEQAEALLIAGKKGIPTVHSLSASSALCFLPLYEEEYWEGKGAKEHLPLGMILVRAAAFTEADLQFLQILQDFFTAFATQKMREEDLRRRAEALTHEVTDVQQTQWQVAQKLRLKFFDEHLIGGRSPAMAEVFALLERVVPTVTTVLLEGESGTGKELIAQAIHYKGPLRDKPLVVVSCGALHSELFESQLFGHVKGAFTGAVADQVGFLAQAHGGTLFLDEIQEVPLATQAKLLRALQEGEYQPVGSHETRQANFRLIAASDGLLEERIETGSFRKDLYFRLNVVSIRIPPLRERREDIPLLVEAFLREFAERNNQPKKKISAGGLKLLCEAPWPGNVRQLRNTLEMVLTLTSGHSIREKDLLLELNPIQREKRPLPLAKAKEAFLKGYLDRLMVEANGQVPEAARLAGTTRESLYRLLREHR